MDADISAENLLVKQMNEFSPDVAILLLSCTHRDDVDEDVLFLKKISEQYEKVNGIHLPIVAVVNKCDEMAPARIKNPAEYGENKRKKIEEVVQRFKRIIIDNGLKLENIVAISTLIDWQTADGMEIDVDKINCLPRSDIENLQISFDGRYNIAELYTALEKAILDTEALMGLRMAARLDGVVKRVANQLVAVCSSISMAVAATPVPISDIYILLVIQSVLVAGIAALSGRDLTLDTAKDFIFSMGGITGAGYTFRLIAQQASKLLNGIIPITGSVVSAAIAGTGTLTIGHAAIAYYIEGKSMKGAKEILEKIKREKKMDKEGKHERELQ